MSSTPRPEDLEPEQTEGFKVGEKKTIDEYQQLGGSPIPEPEGQNHMSGVFEMAFTVATCSPRTARAAQSNSAVVRHKHCKIAHGSRGQH